MNNLIANLNLRAETPEELLPLISLINSYLDFGDFDAISMVIDNVLKENSNILVIMSAMRCSNRAKYRIEKWEQFLKIAKEKIDSLGEDGNFVLSGLI